MEFTQQLLDNKLLSLVPEAILYMMAAYFAFKVLDFFTGLLKTWKKVTPYKSRIMRNGIISWISEMLAIFFVAILDFLLGLNWYLTGFTLTLFVYKEGGSIAENLSVLGVDMPGIVRETLDKEFKNKGENKNE